MSWLGWAAIVLLGIAGLNVVFVSVLITISWIQERTRRKKR